ncbi:restriction endonuclease subunit S [Lacrimispora amygdalina]|uniref:Restriction endonuclease subunit S n=1 Tax=Lacrimispora amygdalina TaxID=253257 RepID=A0A3E2NGH6_9FIRM|nr:restriction endonuclease subunit S [Clostridium indicum]RFZ80033.1 restriction endonuclease subunit S [Clostridium indicum]
MKTITLSDVSVNGRGYYGIGASAVPFSGDLYTYLRITDINDDGTLNMADLKSVDDEKACEYLLQPNDIVFARTGASTGRNYFYDGSDGKFVYAGFLIKFSIDPSKINPKYVKYFCLSQQYKDWIHSFNTGSTRGNINAQTLGKMPIPELEREKQDALVEILSSIDTKIKQNNAINENLEQQAKAIYQQMFIENTSPDWAEGSLRDIADITMGQSPSGSSYNEDGIGTIFFQGRAEFSFRFPTIRLYTTEPKRMAYANDILMSVRAPVGDLNIAHTDCCIGRGLAAIHSKTNHQSFVLYTMFSLRKQLDVFNGEGTVFGSINRNSLNDMPILIPSDETIEEFEKIVAPMDAAIRNNYDEICRLQAVRDSLLPRLMSGELDVSSLDI